MRAVWNLLRNLVRIGRVDRAAAVPQLELQGGDLQPKADVLRQQGVYFLEPVGARGATLAPNGVSSSAVTVGLGGEVPGDSIGPGEGGLHYLGSFKVFLADDGTVAIGSKVPEDFVALASLVDARLASIRTVFNTHVHTGVTTGGGSSAVPAAPMPAAVSVASSKVRAE